MTLAAEKCMEHIGETAAMADHDRDLVCELNTRLDRLWRCDQYIANAQGHQDLVSFWTDVKSQEQGNIDRLRGLIRGEIDKNCF